MAKAAYNTPVSIKEEENETIIRISMRLYWIICREEEWKDVFSPAYDGCTNSDLKQHALEYVHLVSEVSFRRSPNLGDKKSQNDP